MWPGVCVPASLRRPPRHGQCPEAGIGKVQSTERKKEAKSSKAGAGQDFHSPGLSFLIWKVEIIIPPNAKGYREHSVSQRSKKCSGTSAKAGHETSSEASLIVSDPSAALSWGLLKLMVQPSVPAL